MSRVTADVLIIGGGVAGLWARAVLRRAGWSVVLAESTALGAGQTAASQGILHRGVKYAMSAEAREASGQLAEAQQDWRLALGLAAGNQVPPVDLRGTELVSQSMHLWAAGLLEKATGIGAALAMRSEVRKLERTEFPPAFRDAPRGVAVWEVDEISVSPTSLIARLARAADGPMLKAAAVKISDTGRDRAAVELKGGDGRGVEVLASAVLLTAGEGNQHLLRGVTTEDTMQRRPLHMVLVDGAPCPIFAHLPRAGSDKPRLSITSARTERGWCWSIGGDVAETGVARDREAQIAFAKREIAETLGWIDLSTARWSAYRIDRAEGRTDAGRRPDGPVVRRFGRIIAVWPTKLALAPIAARLIEDHLRALAISAAAADLEGIANWPGPDIAGPPWSDPGMIWA